MNDVKLVVSDCVLMLLMCECEELKELELCTFASNISRRFREISAFLYKKKFGFFVECLCVWV